MLTNLAKTADNSFEYQKFTYYAHRDSNIRYHRSIRKKRKEGFVLGHAVMTVILMWLEIDT